MNFLKDELRRIAGKSLKRTIDTSWFLIKIMVPVSLLVTLLGWSGLLAKIAVVLRPLMRLLGLPGEAALVYISGALLNNYSSIAVMSSMNLSLRDATILAVMCLISHNLLVETAVMKSIGSSALKMALLRIGTAMVGGFLLNLILPASFAQIQLFSASATANSAFWPTMASWAFSTLKLTARIIVYILALMFAQTLLEQFNLMEWLSKWLGWLMRLFGLEPSMGFMWIVINIVGYAYGAGIIKAARDEGRMTLQEGDLFNHHAAISHSLLEDTVLYAAISIPVLWLIVPRLALAVVVVWGERLRRYVFRRSLKAGVV
ncbi:MAG: nucleoside recognition domain-containing protein [Rectinema subterraneum]|uniref:nucleoside recognition domain-containing protein n=1 Tax=Rectinema subterraneum TaxID=2653714 RepID=UPI003C7ACB6A